MKKSTTAILAAITTGSRALSVIFLFAICASVALGNTGKSTVIAQTKLSSPDSPSTLNASSAAPSVKSRAVKSKKHLRRRTTSARQTSLKQGVVAAGTTRVAKRRTRSVRRAAMKAPSVDPTLGDDPSGEDPVVRQAAINALGSMMGSMVVVDPNTGRILSIVNQKLALKNGYQPCSTFKPAVALAALEEGVIENDNTRLRLGKKWYMDLQQGIAHSNNVYFAKLGTLLGLDRLRKYGHSFGFGEQAGLGIEEEPAGSFPEEPPPASHGGVGKVASFGEGISQTPLQLVSFVSAVANGGTLYYLQYPKTPEELESFTPKVKRKLDIGPWLEPVRQGMLEAVLFGTARRAHQPDMTILGKTGSCSQDGMKLGWFAGYNQREGGLAVAVLQRTSQPMGGGPHAAELAGHLFRKLADQNYSVRSADNKVASAGASSPASEMPLVLR